MYNDIWKKFLSVEELVRSSIKSNNVTRKEMKECLAMAMDSRDSEANDNYIEIAVDSLASMFHKKLNDLNRKVDNNFERVVTYQNMFIETCHRLQDDEPKLETKVSLILERILDTLLNRTSHVDRQLIEVMEALKAHNGQVVRTIAQTTNMVMTLAEESSEQHKNLDSTMYEMSEKSEIIETNLQEFQDMIQENINDTLAKFSQRLEIFEKNIKIQIQEPQNKCDNLKTVTKQEENTTDVNFNREKEKSDATESKQNSLNVIEANYEQGVVKIMTEIVPKSNDTKEETSKQTEIDAIHSKSLPDNVESWQIPLLILNKSLNLDSLTAIIHEPFPKPSNLDNSEENQSTTNENVDSDKSEALNKNIKNDTEIQKIIRSENSTKLVKNEKPKNFEKAMIPANEVDYKTPSEYAVSESAAINILMSYFTKVQKGQMTKDEFLKQADPMHQFSSIQEMIRSLKGNKFIPTDFLKDLEEWDKSDTKRNRLYSHQLPESKESQNEDYIFTSYEEDSYESTNS